MPWQLAHSVTNAVGAAPGVCAAAESHATAGVLPPFGGIGIVAPPAPVAGVGTASPPAPVAGDGPMTVEPAAPGSPPITVVLPAAPDDAFGGGGLLPTDGMPPPVVRPCPHPM